MIKSRIPELMKKKGINASDLMRDIKISYVTALKLSKGQLGKSISLELLEKMCDYFEVTIGEILEIEK